MSRHADRSRSSAARQRRHHRRVVNGRMIVPVEIDDVSVPMALLSAGFLAADAVDDRKAIGRAGAQFDFNQCTRIFLVTAIPHESPDDTAAVFGLNSCRTRKSDSGRPSYSRACAKRFRNKYWARPNHAPKGITFKGPSTVGSRICLTGRG
jgi:hypothetical protein